MNTDTNISIIQLIKGGEIKVDYEVANIRAKKDINVHIRAYIQKSDYYNDLQEKIDLTLIEIEKALELNERLHLNQKLENLQKIEQDFIANTLYLAKTLSKIEPRTDKLKKAVELFEQAKIREADLLLNEADLLNDQFNLIAFVEYQEEKIKFIENAQG